MNIFLQHPIYSLNTEPVLLPLQITIPAQISYMTNSPLSQLNSALGVNIPENAYIYVYKTSRKSFKDAAGVTAADTVIGTLDILHASISSYKSGMLHVFNGNQHYPAMLIRLSDTGGTDSGYCGWIWKYNTDINNLPVFFVFYGQYSLFMPQKIG